MFGEAPLSRLQYFGLIAALLFGAYMIADSLRAPNTSSRISTRSGVVSSTFQGEQECIRHCVEAAEACRRSATNTYDVVGCGAKRDSCSANCAEAARAARRTPEEQTRVNVEKNSGEAEFNKKVASCNSKCVANCRQDGLDPNSCAVQCNINCISNSGNYKW